MSIFFTADTHFGHTNIIKYCNRPFNNTAEHDDHLTNNWNAVVDDDDLVFHLGDLCMGNAEEVNYYLNRLNGHIWFIYGNHDKGLQRWYRWSRKLSDEEFNKKCNKNVSILGDYHKIRARQFGWEQDVILMHYAMRVWNKSHHGTWHLYGHSHGTLPDDPHARSIDVGVDCHNYFPISYEQVNEIMKKKLWQPIDHHGTHQEGGGVGMDKEEYAKANRKKMYEQLKKEFEPEENWKPFKRRF